MKLTVLGCNGPFPGPGGATSGYLVTSGADAVCLDLGSGCLGALTALRPPETLTALVFSHWHHDHCADALPLLYRLQARGAVLDVWGPVDENSPVFWTVTGDEHVRFHPLRPGDMEAVGAFTLMSGAARHPVPALMLKLRAEGRTLCYTGDTNTVAGLESFCEGADLLLADGLFPARLWSQEKPHLSAAKCAELARNVAAERLVITHLNPDLDAAELIREARAVLPGAELASPGAAWEV